MPDVERQISERHRELEAELDNLGRPPSGDASSALLGLLTDFEAMIVRYIEGQPNYEELMQAVNDLAHGFMTKIKDTKPEFRAKKRKFTGSEKDPLSVAMLDPKEKIYLDV